MTSVKFVLDAEVRRVGTNHFDFENWEGFCQQLGGLYGKDLGGCFLTYVDGEGDTVTVQSSAELKEALNCTSGPLLKFSVLTKKPKRAKSRPAPEVEREPEKQPEVEAPSPRPDTAPGFFGFGPPWMRPLCRRGMWHHGQQHEGPGHQGRCGRWGGWHAANPEWKEMKREWKEMFAKRGALPEWARAGNPVQFALVDAEVTSMPLLVWARRFIRLTQVDGRNVLTVDSGKVSFAQQAGARFFFINHDDGSFSFQLVDSGETKQYLAVSSAGDLEITTCETKLRAISIGEQLQDPWVKQMQQLESMGFVPEIVAPLLTKFAGDVDSVVRHLFEG